MMFSIATLFIFLSFYIFYNTSARAVKHSGLGLEAQVYDHQKPAKLIALALEIIAFIMYLKLFGLTSGVLIFLISVMTLGSFTILSTPLQLINYKNIALIFFGAICIELFLF